MPSVKLEGSITLPDGTRTGPFVLNIPLLPPVGRHVTEAPQPQDAGVEKPAPAEGDGV